LSEVEPQTIYISGPISLGGSCTEEEVIAFTAIFTQWAKSLRHVGHTVINPCEVPQQDSWEAYMRYGMRAVANCDRVVALPRWEESRGARLEIFVARELGIPVTEVNDL